MLLHSAPPHRPSGEWHRRDEVRHEIDELLRRLLCRIEHFLLVRHATFYTCGVVGHARHREHLSTHVAGRDGLKYCRHSHEVGTGIFQPVDFSRSLVLGSGHERVDAVRMELDRFRSILVLAPCAQRMRSEIYIVRTVHGHEALSESRVIVSTKRGFSGHVDVVRDDSKISRTHLIIDRACRIRENDGTCAHADHGAETIDTLLRGVALVVVVTSLHHDHSYASDLAEPQGSGVAGSGGFGEVGDVLVAERLGVLEPLCELSEA